MKYFYNSYKALYNWDLFRPNNQFMHEKNSIILSYQSYISNDCDISSNVSSFELFWVFLWENIFF